MHASLAMGNMWLIVPITELICQCYILALQTVYLSLIDFICIQIACQFGLWWGLMLGASEMRINVTSPRLPVMQLRTLFDKQSHIMADSNHCSWGPFYWNGLTLIPVWMCTFTSYLIGYVITYPCWDYIYCILIKRVPVCESSNRHTFVASFVQSMLEQLFFCEMSYLH